MSYPFSEKSFEERCVISHKMRTKYPGRLPVLLVIYGKDKSKIPSKYIVPEVITMGKFIRDIRKKANLSEYESLYLIIDNTLVSSQELLLSVYLKHASKDGFLYGQLMFENTFGFLSNKR